MVGGDERVQPRALLDGLARCACDHGSADCDRALVLERAGWAVGRCEAGVGAWEITAAGTAAGADGWVVLGAWSFADVEGAGTACDDRTHTFRWSQRLTPSTAGVALAAAGWPGLDRRGGEVTLRCGGKGWERVETGGDGVRAGEFPPF